MRTLSSLALVVLLSAAAGGDEVAVIRNGKPVIDIVTDARGAETNDAKVLAEAARWLGESLHAATGVRPAEADQAGARPAIVLALAGSWPQVAEQAKLKPDAYEAYCIVSKVDRVYVLGNSATATQHGVADLLRRWGFRWFAPSPRWRHVPELKDVSVQLNIAASPALADRGIWYAYGNPGDDLAPLMHNYRQWVIANRLSSVRLMQTGHSYGNIIGRNPKAFQQHPEYYALLEDGQRDSQRAVNARKFCFSNPGLIKLVIEDRARLLDERQKVNPAAFMVSVDPSDGQGTCHCDNCAKLGTTTDRVFHLANEVARGLRGKDPKAWVGLYAYSSHRLPPTIEVEPNVYVQVAMGFNRTKYTLPELVDAWSKKVGAIGLRDTTGSRPGTGGCRDVCGAKVDYHRRWIPYYAERKLNAINAETNSNWGAQTVGLYVASQLMWDPSADVDALVDEYFDRSFGAVAEPLRRMYARFEEAPPLRAATLLPMFRDLQEADRQLHEQNVVDTAIEARLTDLMSYLVFVARFREFDLVRSREAERGDAYYQALQPLMTYVWRTRDRDMVHYYALARRLCNGLPVTDKRPDFYMFRKEQPPVWMTGERLKDAEIRALFRETIGRLEADGDPTVAFSRYLEPVQPPGEDAGAAKVFNDPRVAVSRFRRSLRGYLVPRGQQTVPLAIEPASRRVTVTVHSPRDEVLFEREFRRVEDNGSAESKLQTFEVSLPRANEYRIQITGDFVLHVPPESPLVFEASASHPAWIDYSGPHYFYVPRGTRELIVDAEPRLSLFIPGQTKRRDVIPADRVAGKKHVVIPVDRSAAGRVWHTSSMTRGTVSLLNVPPLLSFHRQTLFVPREVAESDQLTTAPAER